MKLFERFVPSVALATIVLAGPAVAQDDDFGGDEIVVRASLIPDEKRSTSEIASFLDSADFERAGDSDIASALRRVAGLSIQDGRFVIVRGLNERYSSATLNGLPLPSPEPLRRAAPLDLFPTSVIGSTLVQKTFSPQFSGEFGGGLVELRTVSIPDEDFLEIGIDFSFDTETTLRDGLFHDGSGTDVFGFDDGLRDIPDAASALLSGNPTAAEQNAADVSFNQLETLLITEDDAPANGGGSISLGKRWDTAGDLTVGTVFYIGYDNEWESRVGTRFRDEGVNSTESSFRQTRQDVGIAALSSTGIEFNSDHSLQLTGLLVRKSLKTSEIETLSVPNDDDDFLFERTDFIERQLWQGQLVGEHIFPDLSDLEATWRLSYGGADRDQPYVRQTAFQQVTIDGEDTFLFTVDQDRSNIDNRFLQDENLAGGIDFMLPFDAFNSPVEFKFGAAYTENTRETQQRFFAFRGTFPSEVLGSRADVIFSDEVLGLDQARIDFRSVRQEPDNFDGSLEVLAAYASADFELGPYLRAALGVRFEDSTQEVDAFTTSDPTFSVLAGGTAIEEEYILPAVTVTWNPFGNLQMRGGYSQTITRPQFRELSPSIFTNPDTNQDFFGNPFLQNTEIENFDVRAEWYFRRGEFATLGLFYKNLTNPIEDAIVTQGEAVRTTFVNAPSAELFGFEIEFEKNFDLDTWFEGDWAYGSEVVFKTNYTYTDGAVSNDGTLIVPNVSGQGVTSSLRDASANIEDGTRLVGLSERLFNVQLGLETVTDTQVTLAANYASERTIIRGEAISGGNFLPSVVEQPPVSLDLTINQPVEVLSGTYDLTLKVQNILGESYNAFYADGGEVEVERFDAYQQYDIGRVLSIGVSRSF